MPLDPDGLQDALAEFFADPPVVLKPDGTADIPASQAACANEWGLIMEAYAADVVPPSTTVSAAAATLASSLAAAFATPAAAAAVDAAFSAFAATVGTGMAPSFVATPPAAPPGFATQLLTSQPTHAAAAAAFTLLIDTWMRTGTAVPAGGGPAVPWS